MRTYQDQLSGTVDRARDLRRNVTDAEKKLWVGLRQTFPTLRFRRQVPVGPYFVDFLSVRAGLVVEVDGGQHDDDAAYDARRTAVLNHHGFRVERFWNDDVLSNLDGVLQRLTVLVPDVREGEPT
ncbi:endonuclease domain-containing protein [Sphingomonas sp. Leaf10]|uniref:endonuclease domain-containing protein n=1 Tax=Sphingomonas sp. Leaf10 TaxID=1735676 RepID=UPI00070117BF|nr:DUF559 domain-containing protein [Sphingomonas sp. Leaf10]KQM36123.1 hypothetical protein ASE59_15820 [Sphingomonas sp. Leaf10]